MGLRVLAMLLPIIRNSLTILLSLKIMFHFLIVDLEAHFLIALGVVRLTASFSESLSICPSLSPITRGFLCIFRALSNCLSKKSSFLLFQLSSLLRLQPLYGIVPPI